MARNFPSLYGAPLTVPIQVKPLLRDPELHWKPGRSAYQSAESWVNGSLRDAGGLPRAVRCTLDQAEEWRGAEMVVGFFEHATALDTLTGPSSNDVLAVCRLSDTLGVMAVEAKAGETFGELVSVWNTSPGKASRLDWVCSLFGIEPSACNELRWQLFHRTASAVIEAKRFQARHAVMMVHDFSKTPSWVADYCAFANAIGITGAEVGGMSEPKLVDGVSLRLGWTHEAAADQLQV
jgi:hypothetical protein